MIALADEKKKEVSSFFAALQTRAKKGGHSAPVVNPAPERTL
jgi:hypothetical protein